MKHYYYYDVLQALTRYAYVKIETERKLKEELMKENSNFSKITADILNNIKNQLEFQDEIFRAKEVLAFKKALDREHKLYKNMIAVKDDIDS